MGLQVYNTLTRKKEPFAPRDPPRVGMYVCGLTVYDFAHIGHARTAVAFETIRRWLEHRGFNVLFVQNVTDVDDRIINRARELKRDPQEHAAEWTRICARDMRNLGIPAPDVEPRVTQHMAQIIRIIERLERGGFAYRAPDGSVYYSVAKKKDYGKLSNSTPAEMLEAGRVERAEGKRDPKDFALWKAAKPGEPSWPAPWGAGRPGWHIECSAMSTTYLGDSFDIHGGGVDLVFPHHENEVAQTEAATGKEFVKYWLHSGFLTVNGQKMSKSLGNYITIQDILKRTDPEVVRFYYAYTQYRSSIDFTEAAIEDAGRGLERLRRLRDALSRVAVEGPVKAKADAKLAAAMDHLAKEFGASMDDDFNSRGAVASLFDFVTEANKLLAEGVSRTSARTALDRFLELAATLTILDAPAAPPSSGSADELMKVVLALREEARARKAFDLTDRIRDELGKIGIEVQDGKDGPTWRRVK